MTIDHAQGLKMSRLLITATILDSYKWYKECPASWEQKAHDDLLNALNRIWTPPTPEILRGMNFERAICSSFGNSREEFVEQFGEVAATFYDRCKDAKQQVVYKRDLDIGDTQYLLYGKADIVRPDRIIDIKTTARWKGNHNYLGKRQHLLYIAASGIPKFEYIVAVFDNPESLKPTTVQEIDASLSVDEALNRITDSVVEFMDFLHGNPEFDEAYRTRFNRY